MVVAVVAVVVVVRCMLTEEERLELSGRAETYLATRAANRRGRVAKSKRRGLYLSLLWLWLPALGNIAYHMFHCDSITVDPCAQALVVSSAALLSWKRGSVP